MSYVEAPRPSESKAQAQLSLGVNLVFDIWWNSWPPLLKIQRPEPGSGPRSSRSSKNSSPLISYQMLRLDPLAVPRPAPDVTPILYSSVELLGEKEMPRRAVAGKTRPIRALEK